MFLYPTETVYGLGVNALDEAAVAALFALKGRPDGKGCSWLVRDVHDIERFADVSDTARRVIAEYLPGPVTVVLPARPVYWSYATANDGTLSFRISSDVFAKQLIRDFWHIHNAPLTCTSANVSGLPTLATPSEILQQFSDAGRDTSQVEVIQGESRHGQPSTVVRIIDDQVEVLRQGRVVIDLVS